MLRTSELPNKLDGHLLICVFILSLIYCPCLITAQQPYASRNCGGNNSVPSILGYTCNGVNKTCQSYLIYRTQPPYNTVYSIASLFSVNASQVSEINQNISQNFTMATNTEVIIPVTCSCAGKFYQVNTTHVVKAHDNYYVLANNTFEGLTTCNAIRTQKKSPNLADIFANEILTIPLRCACPTKKQVNEGINYLMSFVIQEDDTIGNIATKFGKFGADVGQTLEANQKSLQNSVIQPFTTLLVPLTSPVNGSVMDYPALELSPSPSPSSPDGSSQPQPATPLAQHGTRGDKKWVFFGFGVVAGGVFFLLAGIILFFVLLRYQRKNSGHVMSLESFEAQENALVSQPNTESLEMLKNLSGIAALKVYSFKELETATDKFGTNHLIKGSVYKGVLEGNQVAIKKMNGGVSREINVLNKINHFSLVRLLGVCNNDGIWYLIYEYIPNGPLSEYLHQHDQSEKRLSWEKRMQVALDVATGLNYLHTFTSPPLVHKDIKSSNILLDCEFRAKIAKFALSRPMSGNEGQFTVTRNIVGTTGYLAPEYLENGVICPMLDVYSFGVLLLEMLTGKEVAYLFDGVQVQLSEVVAPLLSEQNGNLNLKAFIDASLGEDYPPDVAMPMVFLVDSCLRTDPSDRPTMDEIVQMLSKLLTSSLIQGSTSTSSSSS